MKQQVLHSAGPDPSPQGPGRTPSPFFGIRKGSLITHGRYTFHLFEAL